MHVCVRAWCKVSLSVHMHGYVRVCVYACVHYPIRSRGPEGSGILLSQIQDPVATALGPIHQIYVHHSHPHLPHPSHTSRTRTSTKVLLSHLPLVKTLVRCCSLSEYYYPKGQLK